MVLDIELGIIRWEGYPYNIELEYGVNALGYELDDDVGEEEADWRFSATA